MNPKIAVVTTFPNEHFSICAEEMLSSFHKHWPEDIKIFVNVDPQPEASFIELNNAILNVTGGIGRCYIASDQSDEQRNFIKLFSSHNPKSYLEDVVKFSHKIFAIEKCAEAIKDEVDYIIWLDADVITKRPIDYEWLKSLLPADDEVVSYLRRKGLHSECGWVAYNMKAGGYDLLKQMKDVYIGADFADYPKGVTDCHILDQCLEGKKFKDLCPGYVYGTDDINVWAESKLAERTTHRKGNRKHKAADNRNKPQGNVVDANNMNIKTRNCLDHDKIKANVKANLSQIRAWATLCRPIEGAEIVMCSAGPSLVNHIDEIKALQARGALVVCVKHAIDTLKLHGIKPWAVVLLDPRSHVEEFIKTPDTAVVYFVSSMCDPAVIKTLNAAKAVVIGYHAFVNAGEMELMLPADLPVSGGSGTATRSIGLFSDMYGFKSFHLFGYDLSWQHKPNFEEKTVDGQPKFMELSIATPTHKNKTVTRTFWTEGQLLAQSNELKSLYKDRKDLKIEIYGDGLAGWMFRHWKLHEDYKKKYNENLEKKRIGTPTIAEFINAISRGAELSRGT